MTKLFLAILLGLSLHGPVFAQGVPATQLPVCRLDSIIKDAGPLLGEMIYGDEGTTGAPPYNDGFVASHRIAAGLGNDSNLTTGHESVLPSAWGYSESASQQEEMVFSGDTSGGNPLSGLAQTAGQVISGANSAIGQSNQVVNAAGNLGNAVENAGSSFDLSGF